jgi:hypothetical protein
MMMLSSCRNCAAWTIGPLIERRWSSDEPIQSIIQFKGQNVKAAAITCDADRPAKAVFSARPEPSSRRSRKCSSSADASYDSWGTPRHIAVYEDVDRPARLRGEMTLSETYDRLLAGLSQLA